MTLGHVVIGRDEGTLDSCRDHEQAHVRQVEQHGGGVHPRVLTREPLGVGRGQDYYLDNWFERDARRACGECW